MVAQSPWTLGYPDDTRIQAPGVSGAGVPKPEYPVEGTAVRPGTCLRGKITFSMAKGTRPDRIIYGPGGRAPSPGPCPRRSRAGALGRQSTQRAPAYRRLCAWLRAQRLPYARCGHNIGHELNAKSPYGQAQARHTCHRTRRGVPEPHRTRTRRHPTAHAPPPPFPAPTPLTATPVHPGDQVSPKESPRGPTLDVAKDAVRPRTANRRTPPQPTDDFAPPPTSPTPDHHPHHKRTPLRTPPTHPTPTRRRPSTPAGPQPPPSQPNGKVERHIHPPGSRHQTPPVTPRPPLTVTDHPHPTRDGSPRSDRIRTFLQSVILAEQTVVTAPRRP